MNVKIAAPLLFEIHNCNVGIKDTNTDFIFRMDVVVVLEFYGKNKVDQTNVYFV